MRLSRLSFQTIEIRKSKPKTAHPAHINRLLDKARDSPLAHHRSHSYAPHLTYTQLRWSSPDSVLTFSSTRRRKNQTIFGEKRHNKTQSVRYIVKPPSRKGLGVVLVSQPEPIHVPWEKFKPVVPIKPASGESRLLRKLMLSGLLVRH